MPNSLDTPQTISIQARLTNIGRRLGIPGDVSQAMRRLYFLDGFLARLAQTSFHQQFVLGGGLFLLKLALGATLARPTQDADFSCLGLSNDPGVLRPVLQAIVHVPEADAVVFDETHMRLNTIMQQGPLVGVRARLPARLGNARELLSLDLAFGMPLVPGPQLRAVPTTLDPSVTIPVYTYPLETIMAGKVASILVHGAQNTRFKDYFDVHALAHTQDFDGSTVEAALVATCQVQGLALGPNNVVFASPTFLTDPQQLQGWSALVTSGGLASRAPSFAEAITTVRELYGPVLSGNASGRTWDHTAQRWH